jgi:DNA-binding CsgD family transcriptional regulator
MDIELESAPADVRPFLPRFPRSLWMKSETRQTGKAADPRQVLELLSPSERKALELKNEGHTRTTAAAELGVSPNHIKNLWQSARRKARTLGAPIFRELHASTLRVHRLCAADSV